MMKLEDELAKYRALGYNPALLREWIAKHQAMGHHPHPAPTGENPEQWLCKCDPDATWTAVWRILTPEQIRKKFAHLKHRQHTTNPAHLIRSRPSATNIPPLKMAPRYAAGRPRLARHT